MHQLEDVYVSRMGKDRYGLQLVNLVNQMPGFLCLISKLSYTLLIQKHLRTLILKTRLIWERDCQKGS